MWLDYQAYIIDEDEEGRQRTSRPLHLVGSIKAEPHMHLCYNTGTGL